MKCEMRTWSKGEKMERSAYVPQNCWGKTETPAGWICKETGEPCRNEDLTRPWECPSFAYTNLPCPICIAQFEITPLLKANYNSYFCYYQHIIKNPFKKAGEYR